MKAYVKQAVNAAAAALAAVAPAAAAGPSLTAPIVAKATATGQKWCCDFLMGRCSKVVCPKAHLQKKSIL